MFKNCISEMFRKNFIFLPVFYLIMCFMKAQKNFGKITILKIWELFFLGDVKTHFGKLAMKWCIFRHDKKMILTNIKLQLLIQLRFRHTKHIKMTVWSSFLWRIFMQLAKKWPEMVLNGNLWVINFQYFFLQNCKIQEIVFYVIAFDPNKIQVS